MLNYNGTIYRPPLEAYTLLLPVTEGCSHNRCKFCNMYRDVKFRMLSVAEIESWLAEVYRVNGEYCAQVDRVYLVGADPFAISASNLERVINLIRKYLPNVKVISMYAAIRNIMSKTDAQLERLKTLGVNDLYVGVESGLDDVLSYLNKGNTVADVRRQCQRLNAVGIRHMSLLMLGVAGKGRGAENAVATAELLNDIKPDKILINTMTAFPDTELAAEVQLGNFTAAGETENLTEEKILVENLDLPDTYFWAAHSMDSVPIAGYLRDGRQQMISTLNHAIANMDDELFSKTFRRTRL